MRTNLGRAGWLLFALGSLGVEFTAQAQSPVTMPPTQASGSKTPSAKEAYYYLVVEKEGVHGETVMRLQYTGRETVRTAIRFISESPGAGGKQKLWVERPAANPAKKPTILAVDYEAIVKRGERATDHKLAPGDRVHIQIERPKAGAIAAGRAVSAPVPPPTPPANSYFSTVGKAPPVVPATTTPKNAAPAPVIQTAAVSKQSVPATADQSPVQAVTPVTRPAPVPVVQPVTRVSVMPVPLDDPSPMIVHLMQTRQRTNPQARLTGPDDHARLMEIHVMLAWLADPVTCRYPLHATAAGAMLEVSGTVANPNIRAYAVNTAERLTKMSVVDTVRIQSNVVPPVPVVAPEQLYHDVLTALARGPERYIRDLQIQTHPNGQVSISGVVPSLEHKLAVSQYLRGVAGCNGIDNHLGVRAFGYEGKPYSLVSADGRYITAGTFPASTLRVQSVETVLAAPTPAKVTATTKATVTSAAPKPASAAKVVATNTVPQPRTASPAGKDRQEKAATPVLAGTGKPVTSPVNGTVAKAATASASPSKTATSTTAQPVQAVTRVDAATVKKPGPNIAEPKPSGLLNTTRVQAPAPVQKGAAAQTPAKTTPTTAAPATKASVSTPQAQKSGTVVAANVAPPSAKNATVVAAATVQRPKIAPVSAETVTPQAPAKAAPVAPPAAGSQKAAASTTPADVPPRPKATTVVAAATVQPQKIVPVRAESVAPARAVQPAMLFQEKPAMPNRSPVSTGVVVVASAEEPPQSIPELANASLESWLKQRVAMTCGLDGKNLEVALRSTTHMTVDLQARNNAIAQQLSRKILAMSELEPYRVTLKIQVEQ